MPLTPEQQDIVIEKIEGGMTVREIGRTKDLPLAKDIHAQVKDDEAFRERYARACTARADAWGEEIIEIADNGQNDWVDRARLDGSTVTELNSDHVQRSRLRVDARKWMMAKANPKKYGEKLEVGGDPDNPLQVTVIERVIVKA